MTLSENVLRLWLRRLSRTALVLGFTLGVILLLLWLARYFEPKVGDVPSNHSDSVSEKKKEVAQVRLVPQPRSESAVGTIRAVQETNIGSKLLARVMEVNLKAGQKVEAGAVLMRLDGKRSLIPGDNARSALSFS
jgi:multidrug efflux pump subunit AcrA (membrane-fusion protein)